MHSSYEIEKIEIELMPCGFIQSGKVMFKQSGQFSSTLFGGLPFTSKLFVLIWSTLVCSPYSVMHNDAIEYVMCSGEVRYCVGDEI